MSRLVTVFSASGVLGGAVTRSLIHDFTVRAVVNDPDSPQSRALKNAGVEVVQANSQNPQSVLDAVTGAYGCFVITDADFNNPQSVSVELQQGKLIADACSRVGVRHVVFSTQMNVVNVLGISCRHMDAKAQIHSYMNDLGLPLTSILLPVFYEVLLAPPLRPKAESPNCYALELPMGHTPLNMISVEDVGEVVRVLFSRGQYFIGKTLSLSGDKLTVKELAAVMSNILRPKQFRDKQVTLKQFRSNGAPGIDDMANMFDFYCRVDQRFSIDMTKSIYPGLRHFDEWVQQNGLAINNAMDVPLSASTNTFLAL